MAFNFLKKLVLCFFWISSFAVGAQKGVRIGYIDMEYILQNVPEYKEAASQLDAKVQKWKVEIEASFKEVAEMRKELNNEKILLTKELIAEREEDITFKEKEIIAYQQKRFGPKGDLFQQKKRLIQPVQDQVFVAVQEVAKNKRYDFIFDKTAEPVMLYVTNRYDISDQVLLRINRVSKRKQLQSKQERRAAERLETKKNKEQDIRADSKSDTFIKQSERQQLLEERKAQRDSIRAAKKAQFEKRRAELIAAQKRKKDSLQAKENQKTEE